MALLQIGIILETELPRRLQNDNIYDGAGADSVGIFSSALSNAEKKVPYS